MNRGSVTVYCGIGKGKTSSALGHAMFAASMGETTTVIQFLKKKSQEEVSYISRLEPEIKLFRFEKSDQEFEELDEMQQQEEILNIKNGLGFAKKVLVTGESNILILDEVLGLLENQIITLEDLKVLIDAKDENTELIFTGIHMPDELMKYVDIVYEIRPVKSDERGG
ncbi:MAG: cob(I)yrinic acid a,c-diamide adenosyltransferase [Lachnospiraceae bacterium]